MTTSPPTTPTPRRRWLLFSRRHVYTSFQPSRVDDRAPFPLMLRPLLDGTMRRAAGQVRLCRTSSPIVDGSRSG